MTGLVKAAKKKKEYPKKARLNRAQINMAIKNIDDRHPLKSRVEWYHIWSVFRFCTKKKPMSFSLALREVLLKEMDMELPEEHLDDPFLLSGYGINAYFDVLKVLSFMFGLISVFTIPIIAIYVQGTHYKGMNVNPISQTTLGSLGASSMFAKATRLAHEKMDISCPAGTLLDASHLHFGIMSNEFKSFIYCHKYSVQHQINQNGFRDCNMAIDNRKKYVFVETLKLLCHGKEACTIAPRVENLLKNTLDTAMAIHCDQEAYIYM